MKNLMNGIAAAAPIDLDKRLAGNVLIEKLPALPSDEEIYKALRNAPEEITSELISGDIAYRVERVDDLQNIFVPMARHFRAFRDMLSLMRTGYMPRDPRRPEVMRTILQGSTGIYHALTNQSQSGGGCNGMMIQGAPGMGKTSFIQRFKAFLGTQVEYHEELGGRPCRWPQIKYLHIQCPSSETMTWLADAAADSIDSLLGTRFSARFGVRLNRGQYVSQMVKATTSHLLGILIVDDIQNLREMRESGAANILMTLSNFGEMTGIPALLAATYRAVPVIERELMYSSKLTARGIHDFPILDFGEEWVMFCMALWSGFPIGIGVPMPPNFPAMLYWHSGGNFRVAREMSVELFKHMLLNNLTLPTMELMDAIAASKLRKYQDNLAILRRWRDEPGTLTREEMTLFSDFIPPQKGIPALRSEVKRRGPKAKDVTKTPSASSPVSGSAAPGVPVEAKKRSRKEQDSDSVSRIIRAKDPYQACAKEGWVLNDIAELR